jgi:Protein of unknown function (DUF3141)
MQSSSTMPAKQESAKLTSLAAPFYGAFAPIFAPMLNKRESVNLTNMAAPFYGAFAPIFAPILEYVVDAAQRSVLFLDVMRQRGNQYREHLAETAPHVLDYKVELVVDGRRLSRPVNYALVRVIPPAGVEIDPTLRPFVVVDPRAGHGPGIGGFKADSEIGVAFKAGHPCYFIGFLPEPVPGQTIEDIGRAEAIFLERVIDLHPQADAKPCVIGNCQAGWAVIMLAALRPELFFVALQENVSHQIVTALDAWRDAGEALAEQTFMAMYGPSTVQAALGIDPASMLPLRKAAKSALHLELMDKRVADLKSKLAAGGLREAVIRGLLYAGMTRGAVDERRFEAVRRIRGTHGNMPLSDFKATVREQFYLLLIDPEGALAAIPAMLPTDPDVRRQAFGLITEVMSARGEYSPEDRTRLQRLARLFDVDDRLKRVRNVPVAPVNQGENPAKVSQVAAKAGK